jgi:hypothetical protein
LGYIPIVVTDACGCGDPMDAERSVASMKFTGDAILTHTEAIAATLTQFKEN